MPVPSFVTPCIADFKWNGILILLYRICMNCTRCVRVSRVCVCCSTVSAIYIYRYRYRYVRVTLLFSQQCSLWQTPHHTPIAKWFWRPSSSIANIASVVFCPVPIYIQHTGWIVGAAALVSAISHGLFMNTFSSSSLDDIAGTMYHPLMSVFFFVSAIQLSGP